MPARPRGEEITADSARRPGQRRLGSGRKPPARPKALLAWLLGRPDDTVTQDRAQRGSPTSLTREQVHSQDQLPRCCAVRLTVAHPRCPATWDESASSGCTRRRQMVYALPGGLAGQDRAPARRRPGAPPPSPPTMMRNDGGSFAEPAFPGDVAGGVQAGPVPSEAADLREASANLVCCAPPPGRAVSPRSSTRGVALHPGHGRRRRQSGHRAGPGGGAALARVPAPGRAPPLVSRLGSSCPPLAALIGWIAVVTRHTGSNDARCARCEGGWPRRAQCRSMSRRCTLAPPLPARVPATATPAPAHGRSCSAAPSER